jgi:phage anti-repressor protein
MSQLLSSEVTYSSALRYGLSQIKPIEEIYVKKIGRFKLIHKITRLVPKERYSYKNYLALFYEDVLSNISIPPKFEEEAIYKQLIQKSLDAVKKFGLKKKIERLEELKEVTSMSSVAEQHDILINITKELVAMMSREEQSRFYVNRFFNSSNFQLSYFGELMRGAQTYKKFLNLMEYELRILRGFVRASMRRSTSSAMITHKERRRQLRPIVDACDLFRKASMSLKTYVEICNSESVKQLFEPKHLDANKLDKQEFQRLFSIYISRLDYLRDKIFERKPELFTSKIDLNQPTARLWKKMITSAVLS